MWKSMNSMDRKLARARHEAQIRIRALTLRAVLVDTAAVKEHLKLYPLPYRSTTWLTGSDYYPTVSIGLSMREMDSLKDKKLLKVLDALTTSTPLPWDKIETRDYAGENPNRDYYFKRNVALDASVFTNHRSKDIRKAYAYLLEHAPSEIPQSFEITCAVYAYVKSDSKLCRSVVVGVEEQVTRIEKRTIVCD